MEVVGAGGYQLKGSKRAGGGDNGRGGIYVCRRGGTGGDNRQDLKSGGIRYIIEQNIGTEPIVPMTCYWFGNPPPNNKHAMGPQRPVQNNKRIKNVCQL